MLCINPSKFAAIHRLDGSKTGIPAPPRNGDLVPVGNDIRPRWLSHERSRGIAASLHRNAAHNLSNIRSDGRRCPPQLTRQTVNLLLRKHLCDPIRASVNSCAFRRTFRFLKSLMIFSVPSRSSSLGAHSSKGLHKILSWHLTDFAGQFQFEEGCEDFRGGHFRLQLLDEFIDVRGFIGFQQA